VFTMVGYVYDQIPGVQACHKERAIQ